MTEIIIKGENPPDNPNNPIWDVSAKENGKQVTLAHLTRITILEAIISLIHALNVASEDYFAECKCPNCLGWVVLSKAMQDSVEGMSKGVGLQVTGHTSEGKYEGPPPL